LILLIFIPFTKALPLVGLSEQKIIFRSVVFPAPEGPVIKQILPFLFLGLGPLLPDFLDQNFYIH